MSGNLSGLGFDARQVEPEKGFEPLPIGEYDVAIVKSEIEPSKKHSGFALKLELQVLSGQYQNRKIFDSLNLGNPNPKAVQIAKGVLSAICRAVNVLTPNDSSELHNKPMRVSVGIETEEGYPPRNKVKAYKSRHETAAAPQAGPAPFATQNPQLMTGQAAPQQYPTVPANPFG